MNHKPILLTPHSQEVKWKSFAMARLKNLSEQFYISAVGVGFFPNEVETRKTSPREQRLPSRCNYIHSFFHFLLDATNFEV
jgi:hypothetical protein